VLHVDAAGNDYINTLLGPMSVRETPSTHQPANIMGMELLAKLGFYMQPDGPKFLLLPSDFKHF
jgi:hypothetical protein